MEPKVTARQALNGVVNVFMGYNIPFHGTEEYRALLKSIEELEELKEKYSKLEGKTLIEVDKNADGKLIIEKTPNADTRFLENKPTKEEVYNDTLKHIKGVQNILNYSALKLHEKGIIHDYTKIGEHYDDFYKAINTGLKGEEFFKLSWWKTHIREERHHINAKVPPRVNLFDVIEMAADMVAAGKARSGKVFPIKIEDKILQRALRNTMSLFKDVTEGE